MSCFLPHRSHLHSGQADGNTSQPFSQSSDAKCSRSCGEDAETFLASFKQQTTCKVSRSNAWNPGYPPHECTCLRKWLQPYSSTTNRQCAGLGFVSPPHSLLSFLVLSCTCLTHSGRSVPVDKTGECTKCTHIRTQWKQFLYLNTLALDN